MIDMLYIYPCSITLDSYFRTYRYNPDKLNSIDILFIENILKDIFKFIINYLSIIML